MRWKETIIHEFSGPRSRVGLSIFNMTLAGVLLGHLLFGAPLDGALVFGALMPPLVLVFVAGFLKGAFDEEDQW
jgi:hypothetical protein